ncbi:hypothetical protein AGMMS49942_00310 [Spirochaetia bacterium]|nr:hypothetical protein AGMMS49942_00310 [Spirochaetia bacterium]
MEDQKRFTVAEASYIISEIKDQSVAFVFVHPVCVFTYAQELLPKIYLMDDPRLEDEAVLADQKSHVELFSEHLSEAFSKSKPFIVLPYHPLLAAWVSLLLPFIDKKVNIQALSFFHSDDDTKNYDPKYGAAALDAKFEVLRSMIDFPFIKKLEILPNTVITEDYLREQLVLSKANELGVGSS